MEVKLNGCKSITIRCDNGDVVVVEKENDIIRVIVVGPNHPMELFRLSDDEKKFNHMMF